MATNNVQPAGAREFIERYCEEDGQFGWLPYCDGLVKMLSEFVAQQTAAKEAEIERLTRKLESAGNAAKRERDRAEAAERERDSLREELVQAKCLLIRAADDLAALKAGKDGQ